MYYRIPGIVYKRMVSNQNKSFKRELEPNEKQDQKIEEKSNVPDEVKKDDMQQRSVDNNFAYNRSAFIIKSKAKEILLIVLVIILVECLLKNKF